MTDDDHWQAMKSRESANDRRILRKALIAMELDEVFKQAFDEIECVGSIGMSRELHAFKGRPLLCGVGGFGGILFVVFSHRIRRYGGGTHS
jgi:hypothetical protein